MSTNSIPPDRERDNRGDSYGDPNRLPDGDGVDPRPDDATSELAPTEGGDDPPPAGVPDPFDPAALRIAGDADAGARAKEVLLTVPVRKPDKSWFVRVHPDEGYSLKTHFVEVKGERDGDLYLVAPSMWPALAGEPTFSPRMLFTAISTTEVLFLWPVRLPGPDGRIDEYNRSALEIAGLARSSWHRVYADQSLGAYRTKTPEDPLPDPVWPEAPLQELLRIGFKDRMIDSEDHPVVRRLRGRL